MNLSGEKRHGARVDRATIAVSNRLSSDTRHLQTPRSPKRESDRMKAATINGTALRLSSRRTRYRQHHCQAWVSTRYGDSVSRRVVAVEPVRRSLIRI